MISSCKHITFTTHRTHKTTPGQLSCKARDMFLLAIIFLTLVFIFVKSLDISQDVLQLPAIPEVTSTQISNSSSVVNAPQCQFAVSSEAGDKDVLLLNETNVSNHHVNVEKTVSDLECSRPDNTGNLAVNLHENDPLSKSNQVTEDQVSTEYNKLDTSVDDEDDLINEIYSVGVSVKKSICKGLVLHQKSLERSTGETSITNNKCISDNVLNSDNEASITNNKCINDVPIDNENSNGASALESLRRMQVICSEMRDALMSARMGSDRCTDSCDRFGNKNCANEDLDLESSPSKSSVDTTKHSHTSLTHKSTSDMNPINNTDQPQVQLNDKLQQEKSQNAMKDVESHQLQVTDYLKEDGGSNQLGVDDLEKSRGRNLLEVNNYLKQNDGNVLETEQTIHIFEPTDDFEMEQFNNTASNDNVFDGVEILETLGGKSEPGDKLDLKLKADTDGESKLTNNGSTIEHKFKSGTEIESGGGSEPTKNDKYIKHKDESDIKLETYGESELTNNGEDRSTLEHKDKSDIELESGRESELKNNDKDAIKHRDKTSSIESESYKKSELANIEERDLNDEPVSGSRRISDNDKELDEKDGNESFKKNYNNNLFDGNGHMHYMHRGSMNSSGSMVRVMKSPSTISMYEMDEFLFWERLRDVIARCHKNGQSYSQNIIDYYSSNSNITEIHENSGIQFVGNNMEIQLSQFNSGIQVAQGKNWRIGLSSRTSRYLQNENTFPRHIFGQESMNRSLGPLVIFFGGVEEPKASRRVEENRKMSNTELIPFTPDESLNPMDEIRSKTMSFDTLQSDQRNSSISSNSIGSEVCGRLICYDSSSHCIGTTNTQQDKGDRNKRRFDKYYSVYKKFENSEH